MPFRPCQCFKANLKLIWSNESHVQSLILDDLPIFWSPLWGLSFWALPEVDLCIAWFGTVEIFGSVVTPKLTFKFQFRITVVQKLIRPLLSSDAVEPAEARDCLKSFQWPNDMTSVLQAVKPTVNLLDAYGLRKDTGRWVIGSMDVLVSILCGLTYCPWVMCAWLVRVMCAWLVRCDTWLF